MKESVIFFEKSKTIFFESSTEIFSFFEIWLINNPSLIDRFLLKTISLLGGKIVPETVFIFDETGLETKPPKFGMITQSCLNKSSFI